jgi:hypothetical protein
MVELEVDPWRPFLARQLAHDAAHRVDLDPLGAGLAAELVLELGLDARLSELELRDLEQRVGVLAPLLHLLEIVVRDGPYIAHHMRGVGAVGIGARQAHLLR